MKCLLKLTKALPSALELIQIEIVLKEIHVFMISPRGPVKQVRKSSID